jgi:hypothetical protein
MRLQDEPHTLEAFRRHPPRSEHGSKFHIIGKALSIFLLSAVMGLRSNLTS